MTCCIGTCICITDTATRAGVCSVTRLCAGWCRNSSVIIVAEHLNCFGSCFVTSCACIGFYAVFCASCRSRYFSLIPSMINKLVSDIPVKGPRFDLSRAACSIDRCAPCGPISPSLIGEEFLICCITLTLYFKREIPFGVFAAVCVAIYIAVITAVMACAF